MGAQGGAGRRHGKDHRLLQDQGLSLTVHPAPAMKFRARQFEYVFPRPTLIMGIVNVTPDSFSDGGRYYDAAAAVDHALKLVAQCAEFLDISGAASRPGATPVSETEELRRVLPVIETLAP